MFRHETLREAPPEMAPPEFVVAPTAGGAEFGYFDLHDFTVFTHFKSTCSVKGQKKKKMYNRQERMYRGTSSINENV